MAKKKRKIDKAKVKRTILWTVVTLGILCLLVMSVKRKGRADLEKVLISVKKQEKSQTLVRKEDVVQIIENNLGYSLQNAVLNDLDLREIEASILADPRVRRSEIYLDSRNQLHIYVEQREPLIRVKGETADYYLDENGHQVPKELARTVRVPIVTGLDGAIPEGFPANEERTALNDVFEISKATHDDPFLQALVEQIHVDEGGEVWVIPKIGKEKLLLGDATELDDRMKRLKILYREGMKRSGFNQFAELHFKWKGQVTRKR